MKFTVVEKVPERLAKKKLKYILDEFVNMNVECAKFEFDENEYKHANSAYTNLRKAAKKYGYPINIIKSGEEIYFIRRD